MAEELVKALDWLIDDIEFLSAEFPEYFETARYDFTRLEDAKQALTAHKAKPALSEEELAGIMMPVIDEFTENNMFDSEVVCKLAIKALRDAGVLNVRGRAR